MNFAKNSFIVNNKLVLSLFSIIKLLWLFFITLSNSKKISEKTKLNESPTLLLIDI